MGMVQSFKKDQRSKSTMLFLPTHGCVEGVENTYSSSLCAWVWFNLSKKTSAANQQAE
jgi:hypothetical protein